MIARRSFLKMLLTVVVAPSVAAVAPVPPRRISIIIESDPGMVSVEWIEKILAPELQKMVGLKASTGQRLINKYLDEVSKT